MALDILTYMFHWYRISHVIDNQCLGNNMPHNLTVVMFQDVDYARLKPVACARQGHLAYGMSVSGQWLIAGRGGTGWWDNTIDFTSTAHRTRRSRQRQAGGVPGYRLQRGCCIKGDQRHCPNDRYQEPHRQLILSDGSIGLVGGLKVWAGMSSARTVK